MLAFRESCQEFIIESAIQLFHVYKSLSTPKIGEELSTVQDTANIHDHFAVAIHKGTLTIGHVTAEISKDCWFFLRGGSIIRFRVSTNRHCHLPLKQGRLEVPCELIFVADNLEAIKKIVYTLTIILFALAF